MGRTAKSVSSRQKSDDIKQEFSAAAGKALGFAMHVVEGENPAEAAKKAGDLAALCDQAADHMALAHNLLVTHEEHTDTAIDHLDAALGCLKQIISEGESGGEAPAEASDAEQRTKSA